MKKNILLAVLAVIFLGGALFYLSAQKDAIDPKQQITLLSGQKISFAELHGKPLLVVFWATSCSSCMIELPKLAAEKQKNPGFEVLAIAMNYDDRQLIDNYLARNAYPFLLTHDVDAALSQTFNDVKFTPTTILIDKNGVIKSTVIGENLDALLTKLNTLI